MKGDTSIYPTVVHGAKHIYAPNNNPNITPLGYKTDNNGIFWVWSTYSDTFINCSYPELWSFDPTINQWAWHSSSSTSCGKGLYNTMGTASASIEPPLGSLTYMWVDSSNDLWFYFIPNDSISPLQPYNRREMWKYNTSSNMWTWVRNDTMLCNSINNMCNSNILANVYTPNLLPNINFNTTSGTESLSWTLPNGELMLSFWGNYYYKYSITLNQWAWVSNTQFGAFTPLANRFIEGQYNTMSGSPFFLCAPGMDDQNRIYHYELGGYNPHPNPLFILRRYNLLTDKWAWVSGDTLNYENSHNGTPCIGSVNNYAAFLSFGGIVSTQSKTCKNNLWLMGASGNGNAIYSINLGTYKFTYHRGDTISTQGLFLPHYGTKGVPNMANNPREDGVAAMWAATNNDVWIMQGGNTMWRFQPDQNCMGFFVDTNNNIHPPADTLLCKGDSISYAIDAAYAYVQFFPATTASYDSVNAIVHLYPTATTTYTLVGTKYSTAGCSRNDTTVFTIAVLPKTSPIVVLPLLDTLNCSKNFTTMNMDSNYSFTIHPNTGVTTNPKATLITFSPSGTTTYTLSVKPKTTCGISKTYIFTIPVSTIVPKALFEFNPQSITTSSKSVELINTSTNSIAYTWKYNNAVIGHTLNDTIPITDTCKICVTLIASNNIGCSDSITNCIVVQDKGFTFAPNAFTPNGDNINDVFIIQQSGYQLVEMMVYNRLGQQVFYTKDPTIGWNGTYQNNGKAMALDTYFYYIKLVDKTGEFKIVQGDLLLVR